MGTGTIPLFFPLLWVVTSHACVDSTEPKYCLRRLRRNPLQFYLFLSLTLSSDIFSTNSGNLGLCEFWPLLPQLTKITRPCLGSLFYTKAWELQAGSRGTCRSWLVYFPSLCPFPNTWKPLYDVIHLSSCLSQKAKSGPYPLILGRIKNTPKILIKKSAFKKYWSKTKRTVCYFQQTLKLLFFLTKRKI